MTDQHGYMLCFSMKFLVNDRTVVRQNKNFGISSIATGKNTLAIREKVSHKYN